MLREHTDRKLSRSRNCQRVELGEWRMAKDKSDVESIVTTLDLWVPGLYSEHQPLINISNGCPASPELLNNVKTMYSRGVTARDSFFARITMFTDDYLILSR